MKFNSIAEFALHLAEREAKFAVGLHEGLRIVAASVEKDAREAIGEYQPAAGPFPAWAPLAQSTVADRVSQGYAPDEPLLRTGELRDSIGHEVDGLTAVIGSTSPTGLYQELGTSTIPPRPFLGPAAVHNEKKAVALLGAVAVSGLTNGAPIDSARGYDFTAE